MKKAFILTCELEGRARPQPIHPSFIRHPSPLDENGAIDTQFPSFARSGFIDNTEYETVSILKLIEHGFNLAPLTSRDADRTINDLTEALHFERDCEHHQ